MRIALDDFGTGYSSLSYLHKLPLDKIKIDRSFLMDVSQNPRSLELLKGIVNLSRPLGLTVTVEGVETFEQMKILVAAGQARSRAGLPVRRGAHRVRHQDDVHHRVAVVAQQETSRTAAPPKGEERRCPPTRKPVSIFERLIAAVSATRAAVTIFKP